MRGKRISLDELKIMQEVLKDKKLYNYFPILPTIRGYSIKELVDELIREKEVNKCSE